MARELVYTSARKGMKLGTSGFCTVACTRGMRPTTVRLLEHLSAYRNLYDSHDPRAADNPVCHSHYLYRLGNRHVSILSRIGPSRADHTNRSNKLAHHLVIDPRERPAGGPAWLARQEGVLLAEWGDRAREIPEPRDLPQGDVDSTRAETWERIAGDAGWAGVLAYTFEKRPRVPAFLIFEPGMDMLALVSEALALLVPERRWSVTFNTYFSFLPAGTSCAWRCCTAGSSGVREARRIPRALVLDLTRPLGEPEENPLVDCAREGLPPVSLRRPADTEGSRFVKLQSRHRRHLRMRPDSPETDQS